MRRVHLDFHTSPHIPDIGKGFTKENFQKALKTGKIDSITVFAKCHHALCYYPTKVGVMHPNLDFDLVGAQIEAAHEIGVKAPVYITAGWSHGDAVNHPEWIAKKKDGSFFTTYYYDLEAKDDAPMPNYSWHMLCLNDGEYARHIYELTEEVCARYKDLDGLFYDICFAGDTCYCDSCKSGMLDLGMNPDDENHAKEYFSLKRQAFMQKCTDILRKYHPNATIFFNGGAEILKTQYHKFESHFEMEDLPTAGGGYDKLPLRAKFFKNKGKEIVAMTGKFHLAWGEFGGYKTKEALKYEISLMGMYDSFASVGDHVHPSGEMEMSTYENIGYAYDYLEKIAPFCFGGKNLSNLGIILSDDTDTNEGVSKILLENQLDYEIVDENSFDNFDTIIVLSGAELNDEKLKRLNSFIKSGGGVLVMGNGLVSDGKFQIDCGLDYVGEAEFDCDYILPKSDFDDVPNAPLLSYIPGYKTKNVDAEIYAETIEPYFSRTYGHYCGHKNAPYKTDAKGFPAIAKKGRVLYMAHSLPKAYSQYGSVFHKRYFINALKLIYNNEIIKVNGLGSLGRCTIKEQPENNRICINMAYASPVKRGYAEVIEDILPIYNIETEVITQKKIKRVYLPLTGEEITYSQNDGNISFVVPKLEGHIIVVLEF